MEGTTVIIMHAISGSGKSYLSKQLHERLGSSCVLSKDNMRYIDGVYVYKPELEAKIEQEYTALVIEALETRKYRYLILDNTHVKPEALDKAVAICETYNARYVILSIVPFIYLDIHQQRNVHSVGIQALTRQLEDWKKAEGRYKNVMMLAQPINVKYILENI